MAHTLALCMILIALAAPAWAEIKHASGTVIKLPSGAEARWLETVHDTAGGQGLTSRFRFVMPDLAARVPSTTGPASEPGVEPDTGADRAPIDIDTESSEVDGADGAMLPADGASDYVDDGAPDPEMADDAGALTDAPADAPAEMATDAPAEVATDAATEEAADAMLDQPALPTAPDVLVQDAVHGDIVWLCENWVLPRIASPAPRPTQIIISLSDKELPFGTYDPDALQIFEAFRLPAGRDTCEWEPW